MKNIHLIPTDKYSDLVHSTNKYGGYFLSRHYSPMKDMGDSYQNIYITNDEEIKDGDWTFDGENPYKWTEDDVKDCLYNPGSENYKGCKKIILTTDGDLIKDGIQAIDDEFLEWFVKNPSCERVEIESGLFFYADGEDRRYKIIIPSRGITITHVGKTKQED